MSTVHRYCCCGPSCLDDGLNCTRCIDTDEANYTATFSGVQLCPCNTVGSGDELTWIHASDLNSSHTLVQQNPSVCLWNLTLSNAIRLTRYATASDCSGSVVDQNDYDVLIQFSLPFGDKCVLSVVAQTGGVGAKLFTNEQTRTFGQCVSFPGFSNDIVVGDCSTASPIPWGHAGTGTVTCVG